MGTLLSQYLVAMHYGLAATGIKAVEDFLEGPEGLAADRPGRVGFVPAGDAHWWHVSTFSRAVVTDMGEAGFRLRQRDRAKALELARRGARVLARLRSEGPAVAARFRAEHGRLTSRENWARLYDQPGE